MKYLKFCFLLFLVVGCTKKEVILEDNSKDYLDLNKNIIEVYDDINLKDIINIKNKDIKVTNLNTKIDTDKLGNKEIKVYYTNDNKKYVYKDSIEIKDTTPPIVFSGTEKSVTLNYNKDLCNLISYGDNYTGNIDCKIEGNYDLNKLGSYKLIYTLKDSSNNIKIVNVTLNVVKKINNSSSKRKTVYFKDIYNEHKKDNTEIGLDISRWQEDIDFKKVKEAGASFVLMRLGVQSANRELTVDTYYKENIKKAKEAGLKVGVYLYSIATSKKEAINQADFVLDTLDNEKLDLPIVFDWESWENWNTFKISFHDINEIAKSFIERVKEKGYQGMLYSSKFYLETIWSLKDYPVWLAHYTTKTDYKGDYQIWQLCNTGRIDGVKGDVDIDILYK